VAVVVSTEVRVFKKEGRGMEVVSFRSSGEPSDSTVQHGKEKDRKF
jgi:hypothetical protein